MIRFFEEYPVDPSATHEVTTIFGTSSDGQVVPYYKPKAAWTVGVWRCCYMLYHVKRGAAAKLSDNPKELAIIKYQTANGRGLFGRDAYNIFSDRKVDIGGVTTLQF